MKYIPYEQQDFLMHHGILGQKWGVRRYQNKDGSLTEAGRARYLTDSGKLNDKGMKRFVDRGDGTYYDATKYARKFGLVGGLIDTARLVKEKKSSADKEAEKQSRWVEGKNIEYADLMMRRGWKTDAKVENGQISIDPIKGGVNAYTTGKLGNKEVQFQARFGAKYDKVEPELAAYIADEYKNKFEKQYKKVLSTTREQIAKDYYDSELFDEWHEGTKYANMTRDEFKEALKPSSVDLFIVGENGGNAQIVFNDGKDSSDLYGYHIFTTEYNIDDDKVNRSYLEG